MANISDDIGIDARMLKYQQTGSGDTWLPSDFLGTKFKFVEDREIGKKNIKTMVASQVNYLLFLMKNLPVESDDTKMVYEQANVPSYLPPQLAKLYSQSRHYAPGVNCDTNFAYCSSRHLGVIKWFLDPNRNTLGFNKVLRSQIPESVSFSKTIDEIAESIITYYSSLYTDNNLFLQHEISRQKMFEVTTKQYDKKPNTFLLFPMGNDVPLRLMPLTVEELIRPDNKYKMTYPNWQVYIYTTLAGDALIRDINVYSTLSDYPIECFGWKADKLNTSIEMNDLFIDYCHYLTNTNTSFTEFTFPIPEQPPIGESGNVIPPHCFDGSCEYWEAQGFNTFDDYVDFIELNQQKNLNPEDVRIVNTVDIETETHKMFTPYVNYFNNPEFMPTYNQIPVWKFSNACQDRLEFQLISMNGTSLYFTEESYNYVVAILVMDRIERFVKAIPKQFDAFYYQSNDSGSYVETDIPLMRDVFNENGYRDIFDYLSSIENLSNPVMITDYDITDLRVHYYGAWHDITKDKKTDLGVSVVFKTMMKKRFDIVRKTFTDFFLIPENYYNEESKAVVLTDEQAWAFMSSVINLYPKSKDIVTKFDIIHNSSVDNLKKCISTFTDFQGVALTKEQRLAYKNVLASVFYYDWETKARKSYTDETSAFNARKNDEDWKNTHPVSLWIREHIYKGVLVPIMDFVYACAPAVNLLIQIAFAVVITDNPICLTILGFSQAMIDTAWATCAPPDSEFAHKPPLTPEQIAAQFGLSIAAELAGMAAGAALAKYAPTLFRLAAQGTGWVTSKISSSLGYLLEDAEATYARMARNVAARLKYLEQDVDGGLQATVKKISDYQKNLAKSKSLSDKLLNDLQKEFNDLIESNGSMDAIEAALKARSGIVDGMIELEEDIANEIKNLTKQYHTIAGSNPLAGEIATTLHEFNASVEAYKAARQDEADVIAEILRGDSGFDRETEAAVLKKAQADLLAKQEDMTAKGIAAKLMASTVGSIGVETVFNETYNTAMNIFIKAMSAAPTEAFKAFVKRGTVDTLSLFGLDEVAQSAMNILTLMAHWHGQVEAIKLPTPKPGEDYPILETNFTSPAYEIEVQKLKFEYLQPYLDAYIRRNYFLKEYAGYFAILQSTGEPMPQWFLNAEEEVHTRLDVYLKYYTYLKNKYTTTQPITMEQLAQSKNDYNDVDGITE